MTTYTILWYNPIIEIYRGSEKLNNSFTHISSSGPKLEDITGKKGGESVMNNDEITFSAHAMTQFAKRTHTDLINAIPKMRILWKYAERIEKEEAYELILDEKVLKTKKKYKDTCFYKVNIGSEEVLDIIKEKNCHLPYEEMIGIFVVRDKHCVTFKTNLESNIWANLNPSKVNAKYANLI